MMILWDMWTELITELRTLQDSPFSLNPMCCGDRALPPLDDVGHFPCGECACALCIRKFLSEYDTVILPS